MNFFDILFDILPPFIPEFPIPNRLPIPGGRNDDCDIFDV